MKLKSKAFCRNHVPGIILVLVTVFLSYKFVRWNWYKVEDTVTLVQNIIKAPGPRFLEIKNNGKIIYRKTFRYRKDGKYLVRFIPDNVLKKEAPVFVINGIVISREKIKKEQLFYKVQNNKDTYLLVAESCSNVQFIKIFKKKRELCIE